MRGKPKHLTYADDYAWRKRELKKEKPMKIMSLKEILHDPFLSRLGKEVVFVD